MAGSERRYFINLTNHASDRWSSEQRSAALQYGGIVDVPFPLVPAEANEKDVESMARKLVEEIESLHPTAVCCQGEMTLTYRIVCLLKQKGICVLAASSAREVVEEVAPDGTTHKTAVFRFCRFREY